MSIGWLGACCPPGGNGVAHPRRSTDVLQLPLGSAPHDMLRLHRGEIIETASGRPFSLEVLAVALQSADIVLVGEQHDHREHHAIQGRIISALAARGPSLVVGLEMLQRHGRYR